MQTEVKETLEGLLMMETSRRQTDLIASIILGKPELFKDLMDLYFTNKDPLSRRAVWAIDTVVEQVPDLIQPYIASMIDKLQEFSHDGLKRNSLRILSRCNYPPYKLDKLVNICF